jgi:ankyrin repeat protein
MYLLGQEGINGNIKGKDGNTILHVACQCINTLPIEIFQYSIKTLGCSFLIQNSYRNTPLHNALFYFDPNKGGDIAVLTYLINLMSIDVNIKGKNDDTLLHYACKNINQLSLDVFKVLIETHGVDVNIQNKERNTPIHLAFRCFDPNKGGDITVLTYLINQTKVHLNITGKDGNTILHYACEKIRDLPLDVFKVLIETHGCDVNVQDNNNDTPLHHAFRHFNPDDSGDITVLTYLINQKNINPNINGKNGHTIFHLACICKIGDDDDDDDEDDDDSDEGLEDSVIQNQDADTNLCLIVEAIAERCIQQVFG